MKRIYAVIAAFALLAAVSCTEKKSGFAIVTDPDSYREAKAEIDLYQETVASRGLVPVLVIDNWGVPDSIRQKLIELHNDSKHPIEGCVFIGDIPVAMVQDAQHLTSAFKMDQDGGYDRMDYCIPTDRFYDSFDLEWDYMDQDSLGHFFYSLRADCPQKLMPDIYSARITPRDNARGGKYDKLRRYLKRACEADANNNPLDRVLYFGGHGNQSDSFDSRMDEKIEYLDHLPWIKNQQKSVTYIDFRRDAFIKSRLTTELQYPDYDYAALHHHGSETVQLLSGFPLNDTYANTLEYIKSYIRGQVTRGLKRGRSMADIKASVSNYLETEVPDSWFRIDAETEAFDEAYEYAVDLHVEEFTDFHPQCRMVALDACYNGSFHLDESIQEAYLFGEGNGTLLAIGSTVNSIQDKWINHNLGLLGLGMRVGNIVRRATFLEYHLFGDPTFAFTPAADCGFDLNSALQGKSDSFWKKQLDSEFPSIQILALDMLTENGSDCSDLILDKFKTSQSGIVRMAAMLDLAEYRDENFIECLCLALNDGQEMVQRFAANLAGSSGDPRLAEPMVRLMVKNTIPPRVQFDLRSSFYGFDSVTVANALDKVFPEESVCYSNKDSVYKAKKADLDRLVETTSASEMLECLTDTATKMSRRVSDIRFLRNYNAHALVDQYLDYLSEPAEPELQTALWEALGWFNISYRVADIAAAAQKASQDERFDVKVRNEALKTYNRIK